MKCKSKTTNTTSHPLEWLKLRETVCTGTDAEKLEHYTLLLGMENGVAILKNSLTVP